MSRPGPWGAGEGSKDEPFDGGREDHQDLDEDEDSDQIQDVLDGGSWLVHSASFVPEHWRTVSVVSPGG